MLSVALLTFTVMVQAPTGRLAVEKLMLPDPATAVTVPPQVLVTPGVENTTRPEGSVSVKLASTAITLGLLTAKLNVEEAFTATGLGLKLFVIWRGSKMMMPTFAVPPPEAPRPAVVV